MGRIAATHRGHCQVCGHFQKLPGGRLAKHGYTKEWGFFNGTCYGSDERPFETHTYLIEMAIQNAEGMARGLHEQAAVLTTLNVDRLWRNVWTKDARGKGAYEWIATPLDEVTFEHKTYSDGEVSPFVTILINGEDVMRQFSGNYWRTREEAILALNAKRAHFLSGEAAQYERYAAWQRQRLAEWTPQPLTPIEG